MHVACAEDFLSKADRFYSNEESAKVFFLWLLFMCVGYFSIEFILYIPIEFAENWVSLRVCACFCVCVFLWAKMMKPISWIKNSKQSEAKQKKNETFDQARVELY